VGHFLGFIDEEDGAVACSLDVCEPPFAEGLESGPAIMGCEDDSAEGADLAIEIAEAALRARQDADLDVGKGLKVMSEQAEGSGLAGAGVSGDECEASLSYLMLHAPAEVLEAGRGPKGLDGDVGGEGIPLEAIEGEQPVIHFSSLGI